MYESPKTQFTWQIVTLLDREESSRLFNLYALLQDKTFSLMNMLSAEGDVPQHSDPTLDWVLRVSPTDKSRFKGPRVIRNLFSKGLVSDDATVAFHLTVKSDFADKSSNHLVTMYALPDFATHLQAYIMTTCDNASCFQARSLKGWLKFRIQQQSRLQPCNMMASQQIQALPPSDEHPFGKCDVLLVRSASDSESVGGSPLQTTWWLRLILPSRCCSGTRHIRALAEGIPTPCGVIYTSIIRTALHIHGNPSQSPRRWHV